MQVNRQRFDIQGLRALAVVLVVVFHLTPSTLSGGYIGVDVFFVISGFLITSHLTREIVESGTIRVGRFWARRVRRLIPAALTVLAVSALAALFILPSSVRVQNLEEIAFSAIYIVNWVFAANSVDYLGADTGLSLSLHYWSLSIEEQFYFIWPLLLIVAVWVGGKLFKLSARRMIAVALVLVFVASFAFSIYETAHSQPSAYFITTTRVWEFAIGGLIAFLPAMRIPLKIKIGLSWAAFAVILFAALQFDANTAFPGWIALVPVGATALLIYIGDLESDWAPQFLARSGPVQFLGDLSYSIYLWHWPLIVVFVAVQGRAPGWKWMLGLAVLTVVLAWLTKRFIEDPVRYAKGRMRNALPTYVAMVTGIAVIGAMTVIPAQAIETQNRAYLATVKQLSEDPTSCFRAYAVINDCSEDEIPEGLINPEATTQDTIDGLTVNEYCRKEFVGTYGRTVQCEFPGDNRTTVLFGNSHAEHLIPAAKEAAESRGRQLIVESRTACSGFPEETSKVDDYLGICIEWSKKAIDRITDNPEVDEVIISIRTQEPALSTVASAVEAIRQFQNAGKKVFIVRGVPGVQEEWGGQNVPGIPAPVCVESSNTTCSWTPPLAWNDWLLEAASLTGSTVIDTWEIMCSDGDCPAVIGGTIAYFDARHLTPTFARTLAPWLESQVYSEG